MLDYRYELYSCSLSLAGLRSVLDRTGRCVCPACSTRTRRDDHADASPAQERLRLPAAVSATWVIVACAER